MRGVTRARAKAAISVARRPWLPLGRISGTSASCDRRTFLPVGRGVRVGDAITKSFSASSGDTLQRRGVSVWNSTARSSWRACSMVVRWPDSASTMCSRTSG
ncbi:hypothetical protein D3C72_1659910 [compost metagenome]